MIVALRPLLRGRRLSSATCDMVEYKDYSPVAGWYNNNIINLKRHAHKVIINKQIDVYNK